MKNVRKRRRLGLVFPLWIVLLPVLMGQRCEGPPDPPGHGVVIIAVRSLDASGSSIEGLASLRATVQRIDIVHRLDASDPSTEQVLTVHEGPLEVDVVTPDESPRELLRLEVPIGFVHQIRFICDGGTITINNQVSDVKLPSGSNTGLKLVPVDDVPFEVFEHEITAVLATFNPADRIVHNRGLGYILKPTVPATQISPDELRGYPIDELIVSFFPGTTVQEVDDLNAAHGGTIISQAYPNSRLYLIRFPPEADLRDVGEAYLNSPVVDWVSANLPVPSTSPYNFSETADDYQVDVHLPMAWDTSIGDPSAVVAIVDLNVAMDHPDLVNNIWINVKEIPDWVLSTVGDLNGNGVPDPLDLDVDGDDTVTFRDLNILIQDPAYAAICDPSQNPNTPSDYCDPYDLVDGNRLVDIGWEDGLDNDGNAFCDDIVGWSFDTNNIRLTVSAGELEVVPGVDCWLFGDNKPSGYPSTHGTKMAGIVAAVGDNAAAGDQYRGAVGVAPGIRIMPLARPGFPDYDLFKTILPVQYAGVMGADVVLYEAATLISADIVNCPISQRFALDNLGDDDFEYLRDKAGKALDTMIEGARDANGNVPLFVAPVGVCGVDLDTTPNSRSVFGGYDRPWLLSVASVDENGDPLSDYGASIVDIAAPGYITRGLTSGGEVLYSYDLVHASGASAVVAGLAALALSANPEFVGRPCELKQLLLENAVVGAPGLTIDGRLVDAWLAVNQLNPVDPYYCDTL